MVHRISLAADAHLDAVRAAIERASAHELALIFPLGVHCVLASADTLTTLYEVCAALEKDVIIIGGDGALRASAVAAGFAAATSLDEWETDKHRAVALAEDMRADAGGTGAGRESGYLYVLQPETDDAEPGLYEPAGDDPPQYVADLLPPDDTPTVERYAKVPTIPRVPTPAELRRDEAKREAAQTAAQERAQLAYEERITEAIRASGTDAGDAPAIAETPPATETVDGETTEAEGS